MKHSIRKQFSLIFIGLLAGVLMLCWFINSMFLEEYYKYSKEVKINTAYEKINRATGGSGSLNLESLQDLTITCFQDNILAVVIDLNSRIVYASPNGGDEFVLSLVKYRIGGYRGVEPDTLERFSFDKSSTEYLGRFGTLENGNSYLICTPLESIRDSALISNRFLGYVGSAMALLGGIIIWFVTRKITEPILELASISEAIAGLNFEAKYQGNARNEIALLGENINKLSESLEQTISDLKTANNELQRDIEKKERIDEMRKEFLSNVSHELKTPIALIQGYAEGLQEGIMDDPESMQFYCEVIVDEANKMNRMVKELMTLNQLEFGNDAISMERFDIVALIRNYIHSAQIMTRQNEIEVRMQEYEPIYVWGDEFKTEEVFMNYFTNAVNHCQAGKSESGRKVIDVRLMQQDGLVRVTVFNTGDPIPEEALPHLWEKFYKVDKARTREYGGSGVGLSIVKAIMESMNREFGVENYTNGVMFWFELEAVQEAALPERQ